MKVDAECNETTPAISFHRFHEDSSSQKNDVKSWSRIIGNREIKKESKTDMESATFETLGPAVMFSVTILCTSEINGFRLCSEIV